MNLPIWSAYIIAPVFILICSAKVLLKSNSPLAIAAFAIGSGLVCAVVLHGVSALSGRGKDRS